jgi:hypothetical protein
MIFWLLLMMLIGVCHHCGWFAEGWMGASPQPSPEEREYETAFIQFDFVSANL